MSKIFNLIINYIKNENFGELEKFLQQESNIDLTSYSNKEKSTCL